MWLPEMEPWVKDRSELPDDALLFPLLNNIIYCQSNGAIGTGNSTLEKQGLQQKANSDGRFCAFLWNNLQSLLGKIVDVQRIGRFSPCHWNYIHPLHQWHATADTAHIGIRRVNTPKYYNKILQLRHICLYIFVIEKTDNHLIRNSKEDWRLLLIIYLKL